MENMNPTPGMQPTQMSTGPQPMPQKKSSKGWVIILVIILAVAALLFFGGKKMDDTSTAPTTASTDTSDLNSIEAELDATAFEGVSDGL